MSSILNTTSTSSNFETLFEIALSRFTKRTGQDLRNHPLASAIDGCNSPDQILAIFKDQSRAFNEFRKGDPYMLKWLKPIVIGLHDISTNTALMAGVSLVNIPSPGLRTRSLA
jgi:hypothetical protein